MDDVMRTPLHDTVLGNFKKALRSTIVEGIGGKESNPYDEINMDEFASWVRKYNKEMISTGRAKQIIPLWKPGGEVDTGKLEGALAKYVAEELKYRQPKALAKSETARIAVIDDDKLRSVVKTRKRDRFNPAMPKQPRSHDITVQSFVKAAGGDGYYINDEVRGQQEPDIPDGQHDY